MKITDSSTLLQQMAAGTKFQVKNDSLHTLKGARQNWNTILNHFRSSQTLATREAKVLAAMTDILRPQSAGGPKNLASPQGVRSTGTPGEALQAARNSLMNALLNEALERLVSTDSASLSAPAQESIYTVMNPVRILAGASTLPQSDGIYDSPSNIFASDAVPAELDESIYETLGTFSPQSEPASSPEAENIYASPRSSAATSAEVESLYASPRNSMSPPSSEAESVYATPRNSRSPSPDDQNSVYSSPISHTSPESEAPLGARPSLGTGEMQVLRSALSATLCNTELLGGLSLVDMQRMVETAVTQALQTVSHNSLSNLITGFVRDTTQLIERQERLNQEIQNSLDDAVSRAFLFTADDVCISTQNSFHQDRPTISGAHISPSSLTENTPTALNTAYTEALDTFCVSSAEKRVLSYLMGPAGRLPVDSILEDTGFPEGVLPINPHSQGTDSAVVITRTEQTPANGYCSVSRNDDGDSVLEFTIPLHPSGPVVDFTLDNGRHIEVRTNDRVALGHLQYTVIVPRMEEGQSTTVPITVLGMRLEMNGQPAFVSSELASAQ